MEPHAIVNPKQAREMEFKRTLKEIELKDFLSKIVRPRQRVQTARPLRQSTSKCGDFVNG
jgi:hypothetical protein